jgi:glycosyltransferase involved in cell wall biosynthesis
MVAPRGVMQILMFGTYEGHRHERVSVLEQGLAEHGHVVATCNVPLHIGTELRVKMLRRPLLASLFVARTFVCWVRLVPKARKLSTPDVVLVGYLGQFDVLLARLLWPWKTIVLDHSVPAVAVARDYDIAKGPLLAMLKFIDYLATCTASVVVVDTEENLELVPLRRRSAAVVVHSGAPKPYYQQEPTPLDEGPLRVIFCGTYTPLHGTGVIAEAIALLRGNERLRFTMIGHGPDLGMARRIIGRDPSVRWLHWVSPHVLAQEMARNHVCLGIFGTTEKAARVLPNKIFAGMASGCAIVTGQTALQARVFGSAAILVPRGDAKALAGVLAELAEDRNRVARARERAIRAAQHHTPFTVVSPLHRRLLGMRSPSSR